MMAEGLQRTLIVGLGEAGAGVVDQFLARLAATMGPTGIVEGIVVLATDDEQANPASAEATLLVSSESSFADWQVELGVVVAGALRRISRLDQLTTLASHGLSLRYPDEVHLVLVADVGQPWVACSLGGVSGSLHESVYDALTCDSGLTGLLLLSETKDLTSTKSVKCEEPAPSPSLPTHDHSDHPAFLRLTDKLSGDVFNRGCFLATLTNESGLVIGDTDDLVRYAAHFLSLVVTSPLETAVTEEMWSGGGLSIGERMELSSFGLRAIRWPGQELAKILSARWTGALLERLTAPLPKVEEEARTAAQRLVAGERLAPPLLVESLAELMPGLPAHLADEVPDPPWPWQLVDVQDRLEAGAQSWEDTWMVARNELEPALAETGEEWQTSASRWLTQQIAGTGMGDLAQMLAHLGALNELLEAFVEGVETQVEEVEADLVAVERRMGNVAASLTALIATFPSSPLETLLRWGLHPPGWLRIWTKCRRAQALARSYAHLLRARLMAWQSLCLYEAVLPFYRERLTIWRKQVDAWKRCARQMTKASQLPALGGWREHIEEALAASRGPWTMDLVEELYQSALTADDLTPEVAWQRLGPLSQWVVEDLDAREMIRRLGDYAADALTPWITLPVDLALIRQFSEEEALEDWLVAFVAQASPFLRYDETTLTEKVRAQVRRDVWLLLPGGETSSLAPSLQGWPQPPVLLNNQEPQELVAAVVRHGVILATLSGLTPDGTQGDQGSEDEGIGEPEDVSTEDSEKGEDRLRL